jgi:hypothetical protein
MEAYNQRQKKQLQDVHPQNYLLQTNRSTNNPPTQTTAWATMYYVVFNTSPSGWCDPAPTQARTTPLYPVLRPSSWMDEPQF